MIFTLYNNVLKLNILFKMNFVDNNNNELTE